MELELKHLAPYLPYGLKVQLSQKGIFNLDEEFPQPHNEICEITNILKFNNEWQVEISEVAGDDSFGLIDIDEIMPLLLPMSSLYTEMEDGTVHIVELAKITGWLTIQDWEVSHKIVYGLFTCGVRWFDEEDEKYYVFSWDEVNGFGMHEKPSRDIHFVPNQLKLFTYLFEHHFDIFGLIDKGLALDKTKIK